MPKLPEEIKDPSKALTTMAMLGSMLEGTSFDKTFRKVFKENYDKFKADESIDPITAFRKANLEATKESLKELPLFMRLNYILNNLYRDENNEIIEAMVNWKNINDILTENVDDTDYQFIKEVKSVKEITQLKLDIEFAMADLQPWKISKCKDCHDKFYMNYSEVLYFLDKGMKLPKRCPACRKARKEGNTMEEKKANVEASIKARNKAKAEEKKLEERLEKSLKEREEYKTSIMSNALKKAGLK